MTLRSNDGGYANNLLDDACGLFALLRQANGDRSTYARYSDMSKGQAVIKILTINPPTKPGTWAACHQRLTQFRIYFDKTTNPRDIAERIEVEYVSYLIAGDV